MLLTALEALHAKPLADPATILLRSFAAERLKRLRNKVRRLAVAAHTDDPASLHALRIGIKRLRYALEFFSPLARERVLGRVLTQLAALQDTLGQLNDLSSAGAMLMDCAGDDPRLREAVTLIGGWHGPHYASLLAGVSHELSHLARLRLPKLARSAR
jgi:adenylate cyclase